MTTITPRTNVKSRPDALRENPFSRRPALSVLGDQCLIRQIKSKIMAIAATLAQVNQSPK